MTIFNERLFFFLDRYVHIRNKQLLLPDFPQRSIKQMKLVDILQNERAKTHTKKAPKFYLWIYLLPHFLQEDLSRSLLMVLCLYYYESLISLLSMFKH